MSRTACTDPQCIYKIAIALHTVWALQNLQNLSAFKKQLYHYTNIVYTASAEHQFCTVQLYLYYHYCPYCLYRATERVKSSYTSTRSRALRTLQSLKA